MPPTAQCVFKGKTYEVWQWEQEMYDGTKKTFEVVKRAGTVSIIALVGEKIILQKQEQPHRAPFLSLPGGRCDEGEDHYEAAKRELLEETGCSSAQLSFWKTIPSPYSTILRESHYYIAKECQTVDATKFDNGEKIENSLITFEEFLLLSENDLFRDADLARLLLRLRLNADAQNEFRKVLFG